MKRLTSCHNLPQSIPINPEIQKLEEQITALTAKLTALRKETTVAVGIPNYTFETTTGTTDLTSLFCGKQILFAIHNMGQGCRYCTLWADGLQDLR